MKTHKISMCSAHKCLCSQLKDVEFLRENIFPKWTPSLRGGGGGGGVEWELKEEDFKQWDVNWHKISLNKLCNLRDFQNCPCVKLMVFTTEIPFCRDNRNPSSI